MKKEAEDLAQKQLEKEPFNLEQTKEDMLELFMYGSLGYATNEEGVRRKLPRQEMWDIRTEELLQETVSNIVGFLNSKYDGANVKHENSEFIITGDCEEDMQKMRVELEEMLEFSAKKD